MENARKHLAFPLDMPTLQQALPFAALLADVVGVFKIGLELFVSEGPGVITAVRRQAPKTAIFLDLKLHDIPETVYRTTRRIADLGIDYTTVHCGDSPAMLSAAVEGAGGAVSMLGVTVLTSISAEDLTRSGYASAYAADVNRLVLKKAGMAKSAGLAGVVCSASEVNAIKTRCGRSFLAVTPGIRPRRGRRPEDDQKRVATPAAAIQNGSDLLVIGRPIRDAADPAAAAHAVLREIESGLQKKIPANGDRQQNHA